MAISTPSPTRRALITGSTSGIGKASAVALARDGFDIVVHGRDAGRGAQVVAAIESLGRHAQFVNADTASSEGIDALVRAAGEVDVLVNNSGYAWFGPTPALAADEFDRLFATNVRAVYLLTAAIGPAMVARGRGVIVNVSSMAARIGLGGGAAYSASKAALEAFTRAWAVEFAPAVRVVAIAPGPVDTGGGKTERVQALGATTLLRRAASAEEIADTIAFIASPRGAYITGATFAVDAGRSAV